MPYLDISGLEPWALALLNIAFILLVTWLISKVSVWILRKTAFRRDNDLPSGTIFINIIRVLIWTIGIATIFKVCFGIDVAGFIAALGVGGIAVSLGFQDTLLNLFGGLQLSLGKLALPGDYIRVIETEGVIKDITWRHTVLIDEDDDEHLIPNSLMNKNNLTCLSPAQMIDVPLLVDPGIDIEALSDRLVRDATEAVKTVADLAPEGISVLFDGTVYGGMQGVVRVHIVRGSCKQEAKVADAVSRGIAADVGFPDRT